MLSFTIGASSITVFIDGMINTIDKTHLNHEPLLAELIKAPDDRDLEAIRSFVTIKKMIERFTMGKVTVTDMEVVFDGTPIANYLAGRMLELIELGVDLEPYAKFMENVHANPASYVHNELFEWLEKGEMPITPDGHFLAFKKVRDNYTDCHTGRFDHSVGAIAEMDRRACNPNRHETCSTGFHFCSPGYLKSFGGQRVMVVKVNPRDVTSIPSDYAFTKGRCCRYEVVAELSDEAAALHKVWDNSVVNIEDPQEFPDDVVTQLISRPAPSPVTIDMDASDTVTAFEKNPKLVERKGDTLVVVKTPVEEAKEDAFATSDGRSFTAAEIMQALKEYESKRGAAKHLGIGDSTLRGWLKRIQH